MFIVSIYNNKGGVGKSTLTVGLAEFLRSNQDQRVLVIDLDAQASSSCSLLGKDELTRAIADEKTIGHLANKLRLTRKPVADLIDFLSIRRGTDARGAALQDIAVLSPDKASIIEIEEQMKRGDVTLLRRYLRPSLEDQFDYVLIDMPGNVDKRNKLIMAGLVMSDFVLVPVEPSQISLEGIPDTFDFISESKLAGGIDRPQVIGMVCNKTDRREEQYRSKFTAIQTQVREGRLPPLFDNILPDTPKLETATDSTLEFRTLREKFDTYYDNVRKVARELHERSEKFEFAQNVEPRNFSNIFRGLLNPFKRSKRPGRAKASSK